MSSGSMAGSSGAPTGARLAFYRMDQSMVTPYPLVHINTRKATEEKLYYPWLVCPATT